MVKLGDVVAHEMGVDVNKVMLLRHSSSTMARLRAAGVSVKQYTEVQPKDKPYNYYRDPENPIEIVVVVLDRKVNAIYRVLGVEKEGTNYALNAPKLTELDKKGRRQEVPAFRFKLQEVSSVVIGKNVGGWETPKARTRTAVQRSHSGFFGEIEVDFSPNSELPYDHEVEAALDKRIRQSRHDSSGARKRRLTLAPKIPERIDVRSTAFKRNGDVIVEVEERAKGRCEMCRQSAPFLKRSDGSPYLEVHHKIRLADGGEDTVENAYALCPNCHRREHFG